MKRRKEKEREVRRSKVKGIEKKEREARRSKVKGIEKKEREAVKRSEVKKRDVK